jgi:tmRNA-binding protein
MCVLYFSFFLFLFVGKGKKVVSKRESAKEAEEAQKKAAAQEAKLAQVL